VAVNATVISWRCLTKPIFDPRSFINRFQVATAGSRVGAPAGLLGELLQGGPVGRDRDASGLADLVGGVDHASVGAQRDGVEDGSPARTYGPDHYLAWRGFSRRGRWRFGVMNSAWPICRLIRPRCPAQAPSLSPGQAKRGAGDGGTLGAAVVSTCSPRRRRPADESSLGESRTAS
jgi:hypothetical protein